MRNADRVNAMSVGAAVGCDAGFDDVDGENDSVVGRELSRKARQGWKQANVLRSRRVGNVEAAGQWSDLKRFGLIVERFFLAGSDGV